MLKVHNFRVGFATNSSSSHSVVLLSPDAIGRAPSIPNYDDSFNWNFFRLTDEETKLRYLAAQFFSNMRSSKVDDENVQTLIKRIDQEVPGYADEVTELYRRGEYEIPSVDHQSVWALGKFNKQTLEGLIDFFKSPRVVVHGGNDNSDLDEDVAAAEIGGTRPEFFTAFTSYGGNKKIRRDGPFWTVYDIRNGTKARISLDEPDLEYTKAEAPELVDLKITDYCNKGCNFCYQSSTEAGVHGDFDEIVRILDMFEDMQVFEVAIGGGEPTSHPRFADILNECGKRGITANFTTLSKEWLKNKKIVEAVIAHVGGIGVSCLDAKGVELAKQIREKVGQFNARVVAQHVFGAVPLKVTSKFLDKAIEEQFPALLLGYKEVGFGAEYARHDKGPDALTAITAPIMKGKLANHWFPSLSVDTAILDQYPRLLTELGSVEALASSREGAFSCYVDAVTGTMGPSSYCEKAEMGPLAKDADAFKVTFANY